MKNLLLLLLLLKFGGSYGQTKQILKDEAKLNRCIAQNTSYFNFNGEDDPLGKGWDLLTNLFKENQFVAWGEYHNSPLLAQLTSYALESAYKSGYRSFCVETSPFVAAELMRISQSAAPADTLLKIFKNGYPDIGSFPFFKSKEDAKMLTAVKKFNYTIWGIDQEFQMNFSYGMNKVYHSQPSKIKQQFKKVYDSLQARWWYPDTRLLDSLKSRIRQKKFKAILDDIKISKEIYRNNDNEARAVLMKKNFFNYYNHSKNNKVFFKLGSNHLAKGINLLTNVYDIGNAVYELSQRNQTKFANVYLMVRYTTEKGVLVDDLNTTANENPKVFSKLYDKEKWVLVDVRKMRTILNYDESLTQDTYKLLEKYDYVLISPEIMN